MLRKPSHYLNQFTVIVDWTRKIDSIKFEWKHKSVHTRMTLNMTLKLSSAKCRLVFHCCNVLTDINGWKHYNDVITGSVASQITSRTIVYSAVYSGAGQRKLQSSASLAIVRGIHRWPVNSPHIWPVTRKMFSFDDVIMNTLWLVIILRYVRVYNVLVVQIHQPMESWPYLTRGK